MLISISSIISRLAEEIESGAGEVERMEATISEVTGRNDVILKSAQFQKLDMLRQHLEELARFMKSIGSGIDESLSVNVNLAMNNVLLADLRRRLEGQAADSDTATGEFELL